jgi:hypothetical protein
MNAPNIVVSIDCGERLTQQSIDTLGSSIIATEIIAVYERKVAMI